MPNYALIDLDELEKIRKEINDRLNESEFGTSEKASAMAYRNCLMQIEDEAMKSLPSAQEVFEAGQKSCIPLELGETHMHYNSTLEDLINEYKSKKP